MDFDALDFGLPSSFNYTKKFMPALTSQLENEDEEQDNYKNKFTQISEAPVEDPASYCQYLKTTEGEMKKIM